MPYTAGPFDSTQWYVQWSGNLPGNEEFSCGLRMVQLLPGGGSSNRQPTAPEMTSFVTAIKAFHGAVGTQISARALLNSVKVNPLDIDGHYQFPTTIESVFANFAGAGAAADTPPNQVALVVSTTTGVSRGPAHRGRFYVPIPTYPVNSDGTFSPTDIGSMKTAGQALITALNAITADYQLAVMSRKSGAPAHRLITGVQVGVVPDTQRRRRRSLIEAYQ